MGMAFFKRRKDGSEEYEEDELEERSIRRRPKTKDFKDLNPENKKRRKEPPKPWGKWERFLILFLLVVTAGTSAVLAAQTRSWKLPGFPRFSLPRITLPFFGEQTIIIEGDSKDKEKREKATFEFRKMTEGLSGIYGLYVIRTEEGSSYGVNENEVFTAASLIKLPVMIAMYKEVEDGKINLDTKYKLRALDKTPGAGSLSSKPPGFVVTYRDLLRLMGKQSDNTAFTITRNILGDEKIIEIINELGMSQTSLDDNETTPYDIGMLFESLWNGNIVSENSRDELLENLTDTIYEDWLAAGLPDGTRFAHKYGREIHVVNDAGIIFSESPIIVVVMSKGIVEKEADKVFPELARIIYGIEQGD